MMAVRRDKARAGLKLPVEGWAHMGAEEPSGHTEFVGQGAQEVAPGDDEKVPWGQGKHVVFEEAPVIALAVPAGQGMGLIEDSGQNLPLGHKTGAPEEQ